MLYFVEERRAIMLSLFTRGTGLFLVLLVLFNTCIVLAKVWPEGNSEDIFHNSLETPQPESNPSQQFGEDEDQTLLFPGYSDVPGAGMDYQVQDEEHLAPGSQNGTFAPGSQDGTFTPGSQDGTFAPGADGTKKSISDKTDDVRTIVSPDAALEDLDIGNRNMFTEESRISPIPVYISQFRNPSILSNRAQIGDPLADVDKKLPFDPSFGWAGKFEFDKNENRNFDFGDDLFGGTDNRPAGRPGQEYNNPPGHGQGIQSGQGGQAGQTGNFDRNSFPGSPGIGSYTGFQNQGISSPILPQGYQENLYSEPHDEEYVRVGYHGAKEMDEGGHGFHIPRSRFQQNYNDPDLGRRGVKSLGFNIPEPSSLNLASFEPARNSFSQDGFKYKNKRSKTPVYGSGKPAVYEGLAPEYYENLVERNVLKGGSGPEDVDGIEVAAEAAVEQNIENDPRYNNNGFDDYDDGFGFKDSQDPFQPFNAERDGTHRYNGGRAGYNGAGKGHNGGRAGHIGDEEGYNGGGDGYGGDGEGYNGGGDGYNEHGDGYTGGGNGYGGGDGYNEGGKGYYGEAEGYNGGGEGYNGGGEGYNGGKGGHSGDIQGYNGAGNEFNGDGDGFGFNEGGFGSADGGNVHNGGSGEYNEEGNNGGVQGYLAEDEGYSSEGEGYHGGEGGYHEGENGYHDDQSGYQQDSHGYNEGENGNQAYGYNPEAENGGYQNFDTRQQREGGSGYFQGGSRPENQGFGGDIFQDTSRQSSGGSQDEYTVDFGDSNSRSQVEEGESNTGFTTDFPDLFSAQGNPPPPPSPPPSGKPQYEYDYDRYSTIHYDFDEEDNNENQAQQQQQQQQPSQQTQQQGFPDIFTEPKSPARPNGSQSSFGFK